MHIILWIDIRNADDIISGQILSPKGIIGYAQQPPEAPYFVPSAWDPQQYRIEPLEASGKFSITLRPNP
ncbi:MAG TPA: hypothetical protein VJC05_02755 [Candidatus Andersenbacteria bacterium]|nr:hypothetical protein [Candidatus Andersenbacteria bacterium]